MVVLTRRSLSASRRRLLDRCSELQHGRVEGLQIRGGDPVLDCGARVILTMTFAGDVKAIPRNRPDNYVLKRAWVDLFARFDLIGTGFIPRIDFKDGLPCFAAVEEQLFGEMDAKRSRCGLGEPRP